MDGILSIIDSVINSPRSHDKLENLVTVLIDSNDLIEEAQKKITTRLKGVKKQTLDEQYLERIYCMLTNLSRDVECGEAFPPRCYTSRAMRGTYGPFDN